MATLIAATTGYDALADFGDTDVELDGSAISRASTVDGLTPIIIPPFGLAACRYIEFGGGAEEMWGIVGE